MERRTPAIVILVSGLILGIIGYNFFYRQSFGSGVVIYTALLLVVLFGLAVVNRIPLSLRKLWLIVPILFFAAMFAFRANQDLMLLNGLMIFGLVLLLSNYLTRTDYIDTASTPDLIFGGVQGALGVGFGAIPTLAETGGWLQKGNWRSFGGMKSIVRGIALAVPIVIVFGVLLSSADLVFAERIESFFGFLIPDNFDRLFETVLVTAGITWLCTGLIYNSLFPRPSVSQQQASAAPENIDEKPKNQMTGFFNLNLTESGIVLTSVVLLFAIFVLIQFTYLFGGRTMIEEFTFAEYARRGFFELVAVSVLTQGLILVLDNATVRRSQVQNSLFRLLSVLLVAETYVILASAWKRMSLYEVAYGFTHLRVFTHVFMVWLAILLVFVILSLFRMRKNVFSLGLLVVAIGYLGTLNLLNVDNYIASRNIERYHQGYDLDMCYLSNLSSDALPAMVALYEETSSEAVIYHLRVLLRSWHALERARYENYAGWIEFNYSHDRAYRNLPELDNIRLNAPDLQSCYIEADS